MKHLRTYEEIEIQGDKYTKLQYCRKCDEMTRHLDDKCLKCKNIRQQKNNRKKLWGVK